MFSTRIRKICDTYSKEFPATSFGSHDSGRWPFHRPNGGFRKKVRRLLTDLVFAWRIFRKVDKRYGCFLVCLFIKRKLRLATPHDWEKKHTRVKEILHKEFDTYLMSLVDQSIYIQAGKETTFSPFDGCIWIYWDNPIQMPDVVKSCISSVRHYANGKKVVLVNEENVENYVHLKAHIWEKYKSKLITKTHFSDIVRVSLLAQYGGIYMDATILQTADMPDYVTKRDFFTFKLDIDKPWEVVSHGNWCVFFIACKKGNLLMEATLDMMNAYWERYDLLIDYLWIDYLWIIASEKIPSIRRMLLEVPHTNPHLFSLGDLSMTCSDKDYLKAIAHEDTFFYKMSYKGTIGIPLKDENGNLTLLGRIIENNS